MNEIFQCGDNTALVGYLYDEGEAAERTAIAAHIAICAACAAELAALESTRIELASWTPPEAELGFIITRPQASSGQRPQQEQESEPERRRARALGPGAWFSRPLPAWAQVAAAAAIFAAGVWLGIERGTAGRPAPLTVAAESVAAGASSVSANELSALERRLRDEIAAIRTAASQNPAPLASARASTVARGAPPLAEGQLMAQVRALIEESEQRQQRELALRTAEIVRDFDSQRRLDLAEIQRGFGQIEGLTGAEVREQRQLLNYLMRVSQQP